MRKGKTTMNKSNIYQEHGYANRKEYLNSLADEYGIDKETVYTLAEILGENEDFDGLVTSLEEADSDMGYFLV